MAKTKKRRIVGLGVTAEEDAQPIECKSGDCDSSYTCTWCHKCSQHCNKLSGRSRACNGFALVATILVSAAVAILGLHGMYMALALTRESASDKLHMQASYAAEAGVAIALGNMGDHQGMAIGLANNQIETSMPEEWQGWAFPGFTITTGDLVRLSQPGSGRQEFRQPGVMQVTAAQSGVRFSYEATFALRWVFNDTTSTYTIGQLQMFGIHSKSAVLTGLRPL